MKGLADTNSCEGGNTEANFVKNIVGNIIASPIVMLWFTYITQCGFFGHPFYIVGPGLDRKKRLRLINGYCYIYKKIKNLTDIIIIHSHFVGKLSYALMKYESCI
ncbi:hypothetical protein ACJX0J_012412, partial [Zea mays]